VVNLCRTASNCPKLHQLACTCAKKYFCRNPIDSRSFASFAGSILESATHPQRPATTSPNSHLLARLAPTCAEKNFCRGTANLFRVHSRVSRALPHIAKSSRIKVNQGNYSQIKVPERLVPNPTHNPNLNRSPAPLTLTGSHLRAPILTKCPFPEKPAWRLSLNSTKIVNRKSSFANRLALTPRHQPKPKVAHCRFSKIRPKTSTLNLNDLPAPCNSVRSVSSVLKLGFELIRSCSRLFEAVWASPPPRGGGRLTNAENHSTAITRRCNTRLTPAKSLQRVAPCRSVLHRVAAKKIRATNCNTSLHMARTQTHNTSANVRLCAPACDQVHPGAQNKIFLEKRSQLHIFKIPSALFCVIQRCSALFSTIFFPAPCSVRSVLQVGSQNLFVSVLQQKMFLELFGIIWRYLGIFGLNFFRSVASVFFVPSVLNPA
jgi:hypothetical protein